MKHLYSLYVLSSILCSSLLTIEAQHVTAEISYGELIDKITILTIKTERIADENKLKNISTELSSLQHTYTQAHIDTPEIQRLQKELYIINKQLWDIEDAIRIKERKQEFDEEFIMLARRVYITNDKRCAIKKQIDILLGSYITEEKSYEDIV